MKCMNQLPRNYRKSYMMDDKLYIVQLHRVQRLGDSLYIGWQQFRWLLHMSYSYQRMVHNIH